jgi:F0F1-type ATP synthase membrane subunit a
MWFLLLCAFLFIFISNFTKLVGVILEQEPKKRTSYQRREESIDTMIQCPACQIYLPKKQAIAYKNKFFCCPEHVRAC